jgi:hypothetical protein
MAFACWKIRPSVRGRRHGGVNGTKQIEPPELLQTNVGVRVGTVVFWINLRKLHIPGF